MAKVTIKRKSFILEQFCKIIIVLLFIYSILITFLYINKKSVSSIQYEEQSKEIINTFSSKTNGVSVSNQIDNYAVGGEHALPVGGGGWCVYKKVGGKWSRLFCSQDSIWCGLYERYDLPKDLLGECEQELNSNVLNLD